MAMRETWPHPSPSQEYLVGLDVGGVLRQDGAYQRVQDVALLGLAVAVRGRKSCRRRRRGGSGACSVRGSGREHTMAPRWVRGPAPLQRERERERERAGGFIAATQEGGPKGEVSRRTASVCACWVVLQHACTCVPRRASDHSTSPWGGGGGGGGRPWPSPCIFARQATAVAHSIGVGRAWLGYGSTSLDPAEPSDFTADPADWTAAALILVAAGRRRLTWERARNRRGVAVVVTRLGVRRRRRAAAVGGLVDGAARSDVLTAARLAEGTACVCVVC